VRCNATTASSAQSITLLSTASRNEITDNTIEYVSSGVGTVRLIRDEGTGTGNQAYNNRLINSGSGVSTFEVAGNSLVNTGRRSTLFVATSSADVANTVTETTLLGSGIGGKALTASLLKPGATILLRLEGVYSTKASGAGTLNIKAKMGSTVVCQTTAQTVTDNLTSRRWSAEFILTCRTTGVSGTVFGQGQASLCTSATTGVVWEALNAATTTIDTTAAITFDVTGTWGTADASNSLTCTNAVIEYLMQPVG
jgi:hypothetical protein